MLRKQVGENSPLTFAAAALLAIVGCGLGAGVTELLLRSGVYTLVGVGLGCGFFGGALLKRRSFGFGIFCGVLALLASLLTEATLLPFKSDHSYNYFFSQLGSLKGMTWLMLALSTYIAYSVGRGYGFKSAAQQQVPASAAKTAETKEE